MTAGALPARPWAWFFLLAAALGAAAFVWERAAPDLLYVRPVPVSTVALYTGMLGAGWLAFDLLAGWRAAPARWLGWLIFAIQFVSVALAAASLALAAQAPGIEAAFDSVEEISRDPPGPWTLRAAAVQWSGWLAGASLLALPPAVVIAIVRRPQASTTDGQASAG